MDLASKFAAAIPDIICLLLFQTIFSHFLLVLPLFSG